MSISTFNFQFYNYKLPAAAVPQFSSAASFSELEMDIDEEQEMATTAITSTPLQAVKQPAMMSTPRYTSELAISAADVAKARPAEALRPQLHQPQKRWSMELREKVLEMSRRSNAGDVEELNELELEQQQEQATRQQRFIQQLAEDCEPEAVVVAEVTRSVSDKINFFNKLTNTYESARSANPNANPNPNNSNRFISLLRSSRPMGVATTNSTGVAVSPVPPPKPKRLTATATTAAAVPYQFATPTAKPPTGSNSSTQRKSLLRRKPSMEKSRATIARQNSSATLRPQRHAMMEDLSLVVPVRLRIAEYEQRISMSA